MSNADNVTYLPWCRPHMGRKAAANARKTSGMFFPYEESTIRDRFQPEQCWSAPYIFRKLLPQEHRVSPVQRDELVLYLKNYVLYSSILVDEDNRLLGGHELYRSYRDLGPRAVPVYRIRGLTRSEKYACVSAYRYINTRIVRKK